MKYQIKTTKQFEKSVDKCIRRGYPMEKLKTAVRILESDGILPASYMPHKLSGKWQGKWECHLQPDWLLVWEPHDKELILILVSTGTHADLFK